MTLSRPIALGVAVVFVCSGLVACFTVREWRYRCRSYESGLRGEVMRTASGEFLYFNGTCWTAEPMPPVDAPF